MRPILALWATLACGLATLPSEGMAQAGACLALTRDLPAGAFLNRAETIQVDCVEHQPTPPIAYNRVAQAPFTTAPVAAGTYLGHLILPADRAFAAGENLTVVYRRGPIAIERDVRLLTPAHPGQRAFVRTQDGMVLAVPLMVAASEGSAR